MLLYLFSLTRDARRTLHRGRTGGRSVSAGRPGPRDHHPGQGRPDAWTTSWTASCGTSEKVFDAMDAEETGRYLPFSFRGGVPSPYQKDKRRRQAPSSPASSSISDDLVTRMGEQLYSGCIAAEPLVTGRSPCRWCDYGFICCHEDGVGERAPATPPQSPLSRPKTPIRRRKKTREREQNGPRPSVPPSTTGAVRCW